MHRRARHFLVLVVCLAVGSFACASAERAPEGEPVRWDQARVTQLAVELHDAVLEAADQVRKDPTQIAAQQRQIWYDLKEDMRMLKNSSAHLKTQLQEGASQEETRATFERIESLRNSAAEHARSAMLPEPVLDSLATAGGIHNRMRPYYYGKR